MILLRKIIPQLQVSRVHIENIILFIEYSAMGVLNAWFFIMMGAC